MNDTQPPYPRRRLLRGLVILVGLTLAATACRTEIEGSDGTITQIDATVQIRYAEGADRARSIDLDDAAVRGPIHVFLVYLGSEVERVVWIVDGEELNADSTPPFDLVGGDASTALPFDTSELLGGNHSVTARVEMAGGVSIEVDAAFTVIDGGSAADESAPEGWVDLLSANQQSTEDGLDGWRDEGNSVIAVTDDTQYGRQAIRATVSKDGIWTDDTRTSRVGTTPSAATAGTSYDGRSAVKVDHPDSRARCEIRFYAGNKIIETIAGPFSEPAPGAWTPVACKAQAPSNTSHVGLRVLVDRAAWGHTFLIDDSHLWSSDGVPAADSSDDEAPAPAPVGVADPAPTTTTTAPPPPTTAAPTPPPEAAGPPAGALFFEDFVGGGAMARFEFGIFHRDDVLGTQKTDWPGDHPSTGPNDLCGPPEEKRTVHRGQRSQGFNNEWIYRCVPGGDTNKAHLMTSIGDTSGYSIGAFTPTQVFTNVREVRWDVNITDLGNRQFPEVKIMPTDTFDFQNMPCTIEWLPCTTATHGELGSVGTSFFNHSLTINNGTTYDDNGSTWDRPWMNEGDPALTSIRTRRQHFFRDNGDNTLTFGIEQPDGTFYEFNYPGSFPTGPVRVVFADHNYTPTKDNAPSFTWHWDNITILD